ncbi:unnamed protein product, partial [Rotaria magnacalcarata]
DQSGKSSTMNQFQGVTTYLAIDGDQIQLIQVPDDRQKPFTFRNQIGRIVQATPMSVITAAMQPASSSFQINENSFTSHNSSQINAVQQQQQQTAVTSLATQQPRPNVSQTTTFGHFNSSFGTQRKILTDDTATMATQHSIDNTQLSQTASLFYDPNSDAYQQSFRRPNTLISTSNRSGNTLQGCLNGSMTTDGNSSHSNSNSQLTQTANHRQQRSTKLYEYKTSTSKQKRVLPLTVHNPLSLQQPEQQYSYSCLPSGNTSSTNMIAIPTLNIFSNNNNYTSHTPHPSSSQKTSIDPRLIPAVPSKNQPSCSSISLIAHAAENRTLVTSNDSQAHLTSSTTISIPSLPRSNSPAWKRPVPVISD